VTQTLDVEVESIAAGGDGVARAAGLVVFLPRTAPGDAGRAQVELKGRFARGDLVELTRPSSVRTEPLCAHYTRDRCGGCQIQHIRYDAQLAAKQRIVHDSLSRIGGRATTLPDVRPSPRQWRYRRKLTLAIRPRGAKWVAGLHPYDAPGRIFPLDDCPITDERVLAAWREVMAASAHFPRARELRGAVRLLDAGSAFVLEGGTSWPQAGRFFEAVPSLSALWWAPQSRRAEPIANRRAERTPSASFAQVNPVVADMLREYVVERVLGHAPRSVVDAYAGVGDTAAALAGRGVRVTAIELDADAAAWCGRRLPAGSRAIAGRVEDHLGAALPADVVLLNPPRAGVDARVAAALGAPGAAPRAVVYVSCNPATLARDLVRMPALRIASVVAFDMFPQTAHVETVCELVPGAA